MSLKRSQKSDFIPNSAAVQRERSFTKPKRRTQPMSALLQPRAPNKPTLELYRPPNTRADLKLNVHAKEFTMSELQACLQHSKSAASVLRPLGGALQRSRSLGSARLRALAAEELDLAVFAPASQPTIRLAVADPNRLQARELMDLVRVILERVVEGIKYSEMGAKVCVCIMQKEAGQTFLDSLLNTVQQWYQQRDRVLRGVKAGDGTKFTAFMWFLTELCAQLKRHQGEERLHADLVVLSVLGRCCQACVSLPIRCLAETECLFFVLTSIGRDLEAELPVQLEQLLASVRDGFLAGVGAAGVRRTLLQLIELHASNWQLPGSSVLYYYPRIK